MPTDAVQGMDYVRPPELKFTVKKETDDYTQYEIETFKDSKAFMTHLGNFGHMFDTLFQFSTVTRAKKYTKVYRIN